MLEKTAKIVVTGAGGFIGGALINQLASQGYTNLRAADVKPLSQWYQINSKTDNRQLDLKEKEACFSVCENADYVFNLAADMGGMGFIEHNKALCMLSSLINTHMLMAAEHQKQTDADVTALKEEDAYPAMAEDGYGWEKLFSERMCRHFEEDYGLVCRVARYHNVYGPL
eukprot:gene16053-16224_t